MALSSALFSGTSGLTSMGDTLQIIGDNIANVNTIGFKSSQADFQDLLSQSMSTMSGTTQIGSGSAIGNVSASFEQGSFKTTGNATDLAIGGSGFFILRDESGQNDYYSRAGNFSFDKDGNLVNPNGHVVQGWLLDSETGSDIGSVGDITLNSFTSQPSQSTNIQVIANLDSTAEDNSVSTSDGTLVAGWNGDTTDSTPISEDLYEYQTTVQVYDSLGSTHDITLYFDKGETSDSGSPTYEFLVTCNPGEDQRDVVDDADAGLLSFGTLIFDSASGSISNIEMTRVAGDGTLEPLAAVTADASIGPVGSDFDVTTNGADENTATANWVGGSDPNGLTIEAATAGTAGNFDITYADNDAGDGSVSASWASSTLTLSADWNESNSAITDDLDALKSTIETAVGVDLSVTVEGTGGTIVSGAVGTTSYEGTDAETSVATINITDTEAGNVDGTTLQFGGSDIDTTGITWGNVTDGATLATELEKSSDIDTANWNAGTLTITAASAEANDFSVASGSGLTDADGTPATTSNLENGLFTFNADFLGGGADPMNISLDFGSTFDTSNEQWSNNALSTSMYAVSSNTIFKDSDGYGAGDLQDINVTDKGVITGNYSNGEIIPLYRIALAGFQNEVGLIKEGGNLFSASLASGSAITNKPGSNGLGTLAPGSLEQSNVDIAGEFVEMITTQRGFQANSKIITTVDTMLSEIINLKR